MDILNKVIEPIERLSKNWRKPLSIIPSILLLCSMAKRPGLSATVSLANILSEMNKLGIPTGPMPDGSPNIAAQAEALRVKEIFRAIREDARVQTATQPGTEIIQAGPYPGFNIYPGLTFGLVM